MASTSPYRINLPVYEGPLDLLLDLIRKQEMDIHNIPIAKVTEQYLDYLHSSKSSTSTSPPTSSTWPPR